MLRSNGILNILRHLSLEWTWSIMKNHAHMSAVSLILLNEVSNRRLASRLIYALKFKTLQTGEN